MRERLCRWALAAVSLVLCALFALGLLAYTQPMEAQVYDLSFVWEAVKALPEKYREAIHLYYYEGYSTGQMAVLLGRKESSVRSDLKRGREKLKMILKEAYDFE